jgi:hypothetical protein
MAGRSALNAEMQVQILLWHPIRSIASDKNKLLPCGVIGNISLFESEDFRFKS